MGDLVNLRQARKRKQREEKAKSAEQNRALHGRTRHERTLSDQQRQNAEKQHDGHKRVDEGAAPLTDDAVTDVVAKAPRTKGQDKDNVVSIFAPEPSAID